MEPHLRPNLQHDAHQHKCRIGRAAACREWPSAEKGQSLNCGQRVRDRLQRLPQQVRHVSGEPRQQCRPGLHPPRGNGYYTPEQEVRQQVVVVRGLTLVDKGQKGVVVCEITRMVESNQAVPLTLFAVWSMGQGRFKCSRVKQFINLFHRERGIAKRSGAWKGAVHSATWDRFIDTWPSREARNTGVFRRAGPRCWRLLGRNRSCTSY